MARTDIVVRETERTATCRGCDCTLPRGTKVIYTYSVCNQGQHIFLCFDCVEKMHQLVLADGIITALADVKW